MTNSSEAIGEALGRVPSGIFILTVGYEGRSTGMLASWVQQAGFDPPMVTVAVRRDRFVGEWIEKSGRFALNQVAAGQKHLLKHFGRGFDPGDSAFEGVDLRGHFHESPLLSSALCSLGAEMAGHIDGGDHRIYLGRIVAGERFDPQGEPMVHLRKTGLHY